MRDRSNGYERASAEFLVARSRTIGVQAVTEWARTLPPRGTVLELGCGSGVPITRALVSEGLQVWAIDASPSMVRAFRSNFPTIPVACEAVDESTFFARTFDGVLAWGLMFLLPDEEQRRLIRRLPRILVPGGRLLFTSCGGTEPLVWNDATTGLESRSLGAAVYRQELRDVGLSVTREYEDEGENHYFDAMLSAP